MSNWLLLKCVKFGNKIFTGYWIIQISLGVHFLFIHPVGYNLTLLDTANIDERSISNVIERSSFHKAKQKYNRTLVVQVTKYNIIEGYLISGVYEIGHRIHKF